jgi:hypothetical protein
VLRPIRAHALQPLARRGKGALLEHQQERYCESARLSRSVPNGDANVGRATGSRVEPQSLCFEGAKWRYFGILSTFKHSSGVITPSWFKS